MRSYQTHHHAIVLLIKQIMDQIDEIASLRQQGAKANISRELLAEMCGILPELPQDLKDYYFEVLIKLTQNNAARSVPKFTQEYAQYSANSKRRFLCQIRNDLKMAV